MGGATSIDVTKPGIDKAYGIGKLRDILGISLSEMIFIGDACSPAGTTIRLNRRVWFPSRFEVRVRRNRSPKPSSLV